MKNYKFIPYDRKLVPKARELRKAPTEAEKKFWQEILKHKKLGKFKFTRQKPLGNFIVDFYCAKFKLAVEMDGELHNFQKIRDKERDNFLKEKFGIRVLRYKNNEVLKNADLILSDVLSNLIFPPDKGELKRVEFT